MFERLCSVLKFDEEALTAPVHTLHTQPTAKQTHANSQVRRLARSALVLQLTHGSILDSSMARDIACCVQVELYFVLS